MKFMDEEAFWKTVNQWVRDGSNIYGVSDTMDGISVDLKGTDGVNEELVLFYNQADYDLSDHLEGAK